VEVPNTSLADPWEEVCKKTGELRGLEEWDGMKEARKHDFASFVRTLEEGKKPSILLSRREEVRRIKTVP